MSQPSTAPGAAVYGRFVLFIYDFWVLGVSNKFGWRCSTSRLQLPFFKKYLSHRHLDIGVGTGYYPSHAGLTSSHKYTMLDLNPNTLAMANSKIGKKATTVQHDALTPLPFKKDEKFDSVSVFFLLHCMPGPPSNKARLFEMVKPCLSDEGVLYGTTILGKGVRHNLFGRTLMRLYNRMGTFDNWGDSKEAFEEALRENFGEVKCWVEGVVLMFVAKKPKREASGGNVVRQDVEV